jgi:tetratricopeptide (TPR) repeat protein
VIGARTQRASLAACIALASVGCVPTLSQPRGEAHLASMADATRHYHHGRLEEAAAAWEQAARTAERRVDRDEAEYRRARALLRLERIDEALALLDALAERRPISRRTVRARFDAALVRRERGQVAEADAALLWIVEERPGDGPASRALRLLLETRSSEPAAARLAFLRELYARVGTSDLGDDLLTEEAAILHAEGDRAGAEAALTRLVGEHPYPHGQRWDDALWRLADLAEEREDWEGAIAHLERMIAPLEHTVTPGSQTAPRMPAARLRIARIYRDRLQDPERAAAHFERMGQQFPTSTLRDDALFELGSMWLERGRRAEGCAVLARLVATYEVGRARRLAERARVAECAP